MSTRRQKTLVRKRARRKSQLKRFGELVTKWGRREGPIPGDEISEVLRLMTRLKAQAEVSIPER